LPKRLIHAEFVERVREHYPEIADSLAPYSGAQKRHIFICPDHGKQSQFSGDLMKGRRACPECGKVQRAASYSLSHETFVERVREHFPKIADSLSPYTGADQLHTFNCPTHGEQTQYAKFMMSGRRACRQCGYLERDDKQMMKQEKFVAQVHKNFPDLANSLSTYTNSKDRHTFVCPKHGKQSQIATDLMTEKKGCPKCGVEQRGKRLKNDEFVRRVRKHYPEILDSLSAYTKSSDKHTFICPKHGKQSRGASDLMSGRGSCPDCGREVGGSSKKITNEVFVQRVRKQYPNIVGSLSPYTGAQDRHTFTCPKHGVQRQIANYLMSGRSGCPACGREQIGELIKYTHEQFVANVREHYPEIADTLSQYTQSRDRHTFICPRHGKQSQIAAELMRGSRSCPQCCVERRGKHSVITNAKFVERVREHYPQLTDTLSPYTRARHRNTFTCPNHGTQSQFATDLMHGLKGCPECGRETARDALTFTHDRFVERVRQHFPEFADTLSPYTQSSDHHTFICPKHGEQMQYGAALMSGRKGCGPCGREQAQASLTLSHDVFVEKVHEHYPDIADTLSAYTKSSDKHTFICPKHGQQSQYASALMRGITGCPGCSTGGGFDVTRPAILYYVRVTLPGKDSLFKVGITNRSVERRFTGDDRRIIFTLQTIDYEIGEDALAAETAILDRYSADAYMGPAVLSTGNTELFVRDVLGLNRKLISN